MRNFWKSTGCLLLLMTMLTSCGGGSTSSGGDASNPDGFTALLGKTFLSPRCQNCHDFENDGNEKRIRHIELERIDQDCANCHFTPGWRAPFKSFSFAGLSTSQICEAIKNKSGGSLETLREGMLSSTLARWGIEDGGTLSGRFPTAPPGSMAELANVLDQWISGGASCD